MAVVHSEQAAMMVEAEAAVNAADETKEMAVVHSQ